MPTSLNINPQTSFSTIVNTFKEASGFFKKDGVSLRLTGDNLHTKNSKLSRWGEQAKSERKQKREEAATFVTNALNTYLKKAGLGDKEGSRLISRLRNHGLISSDKITVKDLKKINSHAEFAIKERNIMVERFDSPQSKEKLKLAVNQSRDQLESFRNSGLDGCVDNASWEMSDHGAGGVILVTGQENTQCVLKFDGGNVDNSKKGYQLLDALRSGVTDPLPFIAPNFTVIPLPKNSELRTKVEEKVGAEINQLKDQIRLAKQNNDNQENISRLESKLLRMEGKGIKNGIVKNLDVNPCVIKMEKIQNAKQINLVDPNSKFALLQSKEFGQNIGKSAVILQFLGFNDHLCFGPGNFSNFSNLMVNNEGHIHLIDPSMTTNPGSKVGLPTSKLLTKMTDVISLLAECEVQENTENVITRLFNRSEMGALSGTLNDGEGNPLGSIMDMAFGEPFDGGTLFYKQRGGGLDENEDLNNLSFDTKKLFVANMIKGLLEGVRFLDNNRQEIAISIGNTEVSEYDSAHVLGEMHNMLNQLGEVKIGEIEKSLNLVIDKLDKQL